MASCGDNINGESKGKNMLAARDNDYVLTLDVPGPDHEAEINPEEQPVKPPLGFTPAQIEWIQQLNNKTINMLNDRQDRHKSSTESLIIGLSKKITKLSKSGKISTETPSQTEEQSCRCHKYLKYVLERQ